MNLLLTPAAFLRRHLVARAAALLGRPLDSHVRGRTVLITGASSGIGEATAALAAALQSMWVPVPFDDRDEVRAAGGAAYSHACDLTDADAVDALVQQVLTDHGRVDMLVNNAGRSIRRSLGNSHDRMHDFERTMAINYFGPVRLTMGLLPSMRTQGFGHVVNIVTWGVQLKAPKFAAYIASKTALDSFARIAGREAFFDNVTFTNLRLSLVRTDMIAATEAYRAAPALSPEQAAAKVLRALEDRPLTMGTTISNVGEVLNLLAPRATDLFFAAAHQRMPDSRAARSRPSD